MEKRERERGSEKGEKEKAKEPEKECRSAVTLHRTLISLTLMAWSFHSNTASDLEVFMCCSNNPGKVEQIQVPLSRETFLVRIKVRASGIPLTSPLGPAEAKAFPRVHNRQRGRPEARQQQAGRVRWPAVGKPCSCTPSAHSRFWPSSSRRIPLSSLTSRSVTIGPGDASGGVV